MSLFLCIAFTLYLVGFYNCLLMSTKNILSFLVASEIMFLGLDMLFIISTLLLNHSGGLIIGVLTLMITVGESGVGLGLCVLSLQLNQSINFSDYIELK